MLAAIVCLLAAMIAQQACAQQPCPTLVVSNNNDVVNGDTSSPCALIGDPGADGISLREAVEAADNATGAGAITITFAPSLAGQTITPSSANGCCYVITRDGVAIVGLVGSNGQPAVTVDASNMYFLFSVTASNFTLKSMRIIGLGAAFPNPVMFGVYVRAGEPAPQGPWVNPGDELQVSNTVIEGNVFSNTPGQATAVGAIVVGVAYPTSAVNAVFSNAVIANNTFTFTELSSGATGAVGVHAEGTNNTVQNVSILNSTITNATDAIELVPAPGSSSSRILNTRIVGNSFSAVNSFPESNQVIIDPSGTNTTVDGTVIEGNVFTGVAGPAIQLIGGIAADSTVSATGNAITNTSIINNLITGDTVFGGISISGGRQWGSGNSVSGVGIVNNTIANYTGCSSCGSAIDVGDNQGTGSSNNTVTGVSVLNTILWNNAQIDLGGITPSQVTTSITTQSGYAGVNGTISSNPQFVNASNNFELQSGSPARHAGTSAGAPTIDIDCQPRGSPPSIGAYEFEGPNICMPTVSAVSPNSGPPVGGTSVTITGTNFIGTTAVDFGSTAAASFTVNSATSIAATAPPGSGTADVTVTTYGGPSAISAADQFTYRSKLTDSHDFNGDGRSDILWEDASGDTALWLMNGAAILQSAGVGTVSPTVWSIVGQHDFNGDGKADILWHDTSGDVAVWLMNGATISQSLGVGTTNPGVWSIVGTGDFFGTGNGDILWRDTSGDVAIWELSGNTIVQSCGVGTAPTTWSIVGTGDFNGDGMTDILWHDTSGDVAIWEMNGCSILQSAGVGTVNPSVWSIAGTGDFNGDGKSDILWRDTFGDVAIWEMNGATILLSAGVGTANPSVWSIAQTGDYYGAGASDILWRDTSGDVAVWQLNGATITQSAGIGTAPTVWSIQGAGAD